MRDGVGGCSVRNGGLPMVGDILGGMGGRRRTTPSRAYLLICP